MIFGKMVARTHSIEFQKKGFPHIHIIIWLKDRDHLTPDEIDKIMCAEIPDAKVSVITRDEHGITVQSEKENPLRELVGTMMMQGPCGDINPSRGFMKEGHGKHGYPKDFVSTMELNENEYPVYCRRGLHEGGNCYKKHINGHPLTYTNADVVPYNKYLLYKYKCHINVEVCHSVNVIKCTLKYLYKDQDSATMTLNDANKDGSDANENEEQTNEKEIKLKGDGKGKNETDVKGAA